MPDIRTMKTVEVDGEYRVAIAKDEDEYEAAIVGLRKSPMGKAVGDALSLGGDTSEWYSVSDAPRVIDAEYYTAVGRAIEAYLEQEDEDAQE